MTYLHPDLGVPCLTPSEFWKSLAEIEGKDPSSILENFYNEIASEEMLAEKELMNNKPEVMKMLLEYYNPEYGDVDFVPTEILEIVAASVRYTSKKSMTSVTTIIKCSDGKNRIVEYSETNWSGSYMDPPDFDSNCTVLEEFSNPNEE